MFSMQNCLSDWDFEHNCHSKFFLNHLNTMKTERMINFQITIHRLHKRKKSENTYPWVIHDLILLYIFQIILKHFPSLQLSSNFCQRPAFQTVSNAFLKSTKQQKSFFSQPRYNAIKLCSMKMLSQVECPLLKLHWFLL
jgi:hypothetical protein